MRIHKQFIYYAMIMKNGTISDISYSGIREFLSFIPKRKGIGQGLEMRGNKNNTETYWITINVRLKKPR